MQLRNALVVSSLVFAGTANAYDFYLSRIPNGDVNSCANCHTNPGGGGSRDAFGNAFDAGGLSWAAVCGQDPDGDNQTNGQELGDPDCVWTQGATPARDTDISDPSSASSTSADPDGGAGGEGEGEGEGEAAEGEGEGEGEADGGGCAGAAAGLPVALLALAARRRR